MMSATIKRLDTHNHYIFFTKRKRPLVLIIIIIIIVYSFLIRYQGKRTASSSTERCVAHYHRSDTYNQTVHPLSLSPITRLIARQQCVYSRLQTNDRMLLNDQLKRRRSLVDKYQSRRSSLYTCKCRLSPYTSHQQTGTTTIVNSRRLHERETTNRPFEYKHTHTHRWHVVGRQLAFNTIRHF